MKLNIVNFRGIASAEIPLDGSVSIAGPNGSGKTSVSMAIAAALSGHAAPWDGVKSKDARILLRAGASRGHVSISDGDAELSVNYPGGSVSGSGEMLKHASNFALGLESVVLMKPADAASALASYIGTEPTKDDLTAIIGQQSAEKVWPIIQEKGWDAAHQHVRDTGMRLKGQWEGITGEAYGSAKAMSWKPQGAESYDLTADLEGNLQQARKILEDAQAKGVADKTKVQMLTDELNRLEATMQWAEQSSLLKGKPRTEWLGIISAARDAVATFKAHSKAAADLPEAEQMLADATALIPVLEGKVNAAREALKSLPLPVSTTETVPCPSCGAHLVIISRSKLDLPEARISEAENNERVIALNNARKKLEDAISELDNASGLAQKLGEWRAVCKSAQEKIDAITLPPDDVDLDGLLLATDCIDESQRIRDELEELRKFETSTPEELEAAKNAVHEAEVVLGMRQAIDLASKLSKQIANAQGVSEALSPSGVRQEVLSRSIASFNEKLSDVCAVAGWNNVFVSDKMRIYYGEREYGWQLSESEKFRTRVAVQMAMANIDKSALIVVDAADILDRKGRNGMARLIKQSGVPVVMTMTMNAKDEVPNLSAIGVRSFWINENGTIETVEKQ